MNAAVKSWLLHLKKSLLATVVAALLALASSGSVVNWFSAHNATAVFAILTVLLTAVVHKLSPTA